jgi:DNA-binding LytR/AlgR family response regulator
MGCTIPIVFVSGHPIRASEGYKVDAADFLVKKYRYHQLVSCLKKIEKITTPVESRAIVVENVERISHRLLVDDIVYAEALDREVILHIRNKGTIRTYLTLNNLLKVLESDAFLQVHKSFVVSTKHIVGFKMTRPYSLYMLKDVSQDPRDIPVGRNFFQNVQQAYARTVMEGMT